MKSCFSRGWVAPLSVALVAAGLAAPLAQANHGPGGRTGAASQPVPTWTASSREIDRLGPKYVPLQHPIATTPTAVVKVVRPAGFDWADAGIGAATASLTLALAALLAMVFSRRNRKPVLPDRSEPAGA